MSDTFKSALHLPQHYQYILGFELRCTTGREKEFDVGELNQSLRDITHSPGEHSTGPGKLSPWYLANPAAAGLKL